MEFCIRIIIDVILLGILSVLFSSWINFKYGKKLQELKPLTAEQILRKENFINSKREVFFEVIELINRAFASSEWKGPDVPHNRTLCNIRPSEAEINSCYSKLCLYADNKAILEKYPYLFTICNPVELGAFINLLRNDLGYGKGIVDPERYVYIFPGSTSFP